MEKFPSEIIERILFLCPLRDVASFSQTSRAAYILIYKSPDQYLWRQHFLAFPFDDPRVAPNATAAVDWRLELQDRSRAELILSSPSRDIDKASEAMEVVLRAIHLAPPYGPTLSDNLNWAERLILFCPLFDSLTYRGPQTQTQARLLVYMGWSHHDVNTPIHDVHTIVRSATYRPIRSNSRCYVYDLSNYSKATNFGVFQCKRSANGVLEYEVNWIHINHCLNVIMMNLWDLSPGQILPPRGLEATRAYSAPGSSNRVARDWAGVEGVWQRYVCFMDYRDLYKFNFGDKNKPCDPSFFNDEDFFEATRLIELKLHLLGPKETPLHLHPLPLVEDKSYPRLHIIGISSSRGSPGPQAVIKGHVDRRQDGSIQWTLVSIYDQQTKWLFDGIQVGNVCSAAGVVGTWTGADHDHDDPSGPSWLWKVATEDTIGT